MDGQAKNLTAATTQHERSLVGVHDVRFPGVKLTASLTGWVIPGSARFTQYIVYRDFRRLER